MRYCANVWFCSDALINKSNAFFLFSFIPDRKSTRLNSSHSQISYAVFCLKKKNTDIARKHFAKTTIDAFFPDHLRTSIGNFVLIPGNVIDTKTACYTRLPTHREHYVTYV